MKKKLLCLTAFALSGCATTGFNSHTGFAIISLQSEAAETTGRIGAKSGEACSMNILGIVATGDSTVRAAAQAGGISNVGTVDFQYTNILGIYGKVCTMVTGD